MEDLRLMTTEGHGINDDEPPLRAGRPEQYAAEPPDGLAYLRSSPVPGPCGRCTTCKNDVKEGDAKRSGDGQLFCRACYARLYLPTCRRCKKPIEGGAVTSSDGKVRGKLHPDCFTCWSCSAPFTTGEFYVL